MRRNPGRFLWPLLLAVALLAGGVKVEVDKKEVAPGETVTFSIVAEGEKVEFPVVREIDGFPILGTSQHSSIAIVNGRVTRSVTKKYTFAPMRSVTVPSMKVTVNGKTYQTDPVRVRVSDKPRPVSAGGNAAELSLSLDKTRVRVGEPIELEVTLRYRKEAGFVQADLQKPEFPNFWIKRVGKTETREENGYVVQTQRYLIFPQKAGRFTLGPLSARIARRVRIKPPIEDPFFDDDFFNTFFARLQWSRVASNSVEVEVAPLPAGVELYGEFTIRAEVDRRVVEANRPVRVTVTVEGRGNVEDIPGFEPEIPGAMVYADDPVVKEWVRDGVYGGTFTQIVTVVADRNFTVPSFSIRYFDAKKGEVVQKRTAPIFVEVKGGAGAAAPVRPSAAAPAEESGAGGEAAGKEPKAAFSWVWGLVLTALGFAGGLFAARWVKGLSFGRKPKERPVSLRIARARDDRELFDLLLPYAGEDPRIDEAIERLERNLYENGKFRVDRKTLAGLVEDIEREREEAS